MSSNIAPLGFILARRMGWTLEGRVLRRKVKASKHVLRLPEPSWCYDANVYSMLRPAVRALEVTDRESGLTYRVSAADFDEHAIKFDHGHGLQYRLPLTRWTASQREGSQMAFALEVPS